jgi:hypothetical protein
VADVVLGSVAHDRAKNRLVDQGWRRSPPGPADQGVRGGISVGVHDIQVQPARSAW